MARKDAYAPVKGMFEVWEKYTTQYWEEVLQNPLFLRTLGRNLEISLGFQKRVQDIVDQTWQAWGLAGRREQELALYKLNMLDGQVNRLSRRVDRLLQSVTERGNEA